MKQLPLIVPLLSIAAVVAVTGALLWTNRALPAPESASDAEVARAQPAAERDARASAENALAQGENAPWGPALQAELAGIRTELAALRKLLEAQSARADGVATRPAGNALRGDAWAELVRETEQRMLVETITRQRAHTRTTLVQEEASAADAGAMTEVREASAAAVGSLKRALEALDEVRTDDELARWREHFGIEPVN